MFTQDIFDEPLAVEYRVGKYKCKQCKGILFSSEEKFFGPSRWATFYKPVDMDNIYSVDNDYGIIELYCTVCREMIGSIYEDYDTKHPDENPPRRYTILSSKVTFERDEQLQDVSNGDEERSSANIQDKNEQPNLDARPPIHKINVVYTDLKEEIPSPTSTESSSPVETPIQTPEAISDQSMIENIRQDAIQSYLPDEIKIIPNNPGDNYNNHSVPQEPIKTTSLPHDFSNQFNDLSFSENSTTAHEELVIKSSASRYNLTSVAYKGLASIGILVGIGGLVYYSMKKSNK